MKVSCAGARWTRSAEAIGTRRVPAADFGATALLSNHSEFDDAYFKAHAAANRKAGEANPFDVGSDGVARYFTVVQSCTAAVKIRAAVQ